jgi:hypothetical protein
LILRKDDSQATVLMQIRKLVAASSVVQFVGQERGEFYGWVERTQVRHEYASLRKPSGPAAVPQRIPDLNPSRWVTFNRKLPMTIVVSLGEPNNGTRRLWAYLLRAGRIPAGRAKLSGGN